MMLMMMKTTMHCNDDNDDDKNAIKDGGVAPQCTFAGPTRTKEHIDPHSRHRYKKRSGTQKREDHRANAKWTELNVGLHVI